MAEEHAAHDALWLTTSYNLYACYRVEDVTGSPLHFLERAAEVPILRGLYHPLGSCEAELQGPLPPLEIIVAHAGRQVSSVVLLRLYL